VSRYVASHVERSPDAVIPNGVPPTPKLWQVSSKTVLVLQRLEPEKDTMTALLAWQTSRLVDEGWTMRVVGDGSQRSMLAGWLTSNSVAGVTLVGWAPNARDEVARAGMLLAPARAEPFGLAVVEAMAAGVPVVASESGGHLETAAQLSSAPLFTPGDAPSAARVLRSLLDVRERTRLSDEGRRFVDERLMMKHHVDSLLGEYNAMVPRIATLMTEQA
jgi:glycosyltransferase involved in cell wall biosynthesis